MANRLLLEFANLFANSGDESLLLGRGCNFGEAQGKYLRIEVRRPAGSHSRDFAAKVFLGMVIFFRVLGSGSSEQGHTRTKSFFRVKTPCNNIASLISARSFFRLDSFRVACHSSTIGHSPRKHSTSYNPGSRYRSACPNLEVSGHCGSDRNLGRTPSFAKLDFLNH